MLVRIKIYPIDHDDLSLRVTKYALWAEHGPVPALYALRA